MVHCTSTVIMKEYHVPAVMSEEDNRSVSEMSSEEISEMYSRVVDEAGQYDELVNEIESKEEVDESEHRIVNDGKSQWREIRIYYNRPQIGGKSIPMQMLRWGRENGLSLKSHFEMKDLDQWCANFVVDETITEVDR